MTNDDEDDREGGWVGDASGTNPLHVTYESDNQPFECTTLLWEVLTVSGNELRLYSNYIGCTHDLAAVETIF